MASDPIFNHLALGLETRHVGSGDAQRNSGHDGALVWGLPSSRGQMMG